MRCQCFRYLIEMPPALAADLAVKEMEEIINYLAIMTVVVITTIILIGLPSGSREQVEKPRETQTRYAKSVQGYWDYLLLLALGLLVLLKIFLIIV